MKAIYSLFFTLFVIIATHSGYAQVTYKSGSTAISCGQTVSGNFTGAVNIHSAYLEQRIYCAGQPGCPFGALSGNGAERSFRFTLVTSSYVRIRQLSPTYHQFFLCRDSSNILVQVSNPIYIENANAGTELTVFLPSGTYYLNLEQAFVDNYSFQLDCSSSPLSVYTDLKPIATPISINTVISNTLIGQTNKVSWLNYYAYYSSYGTPFSFLSYFPQPERVYKFNLTKKSTIRLTNESNTSHRIFVVDTSGKSNQTADLEQDLMPGTYYAVVEQGSATINERFSFSLASVAAACKPVSIDPNPPYFYGYSSYGYLDVKLNDGIQMYVGGQSNGFEVNAGSSYVQIYVDFNNDGDFEDASERVYVSQQKSPSPNVAVTTKQVDYFGLSIGNSVYGSSLGKTLRVRVMVSSSVLTGACTEGSVDSYKDLYLKFIERRPALGAADWARQLTDRGYDSYTKVKTGHDGSVFVAGVSEIPIYNGGVIGHPRGLTQLTGETSKSLWLVDSLGFRGYHVKAVVAKYGRVGNIQWAAKIRSFTQSQGPCVGTLPELKISGLATDKIGNVYVCGTVVGSTIFYNANGSPSSSFVENYGNSVPSNDCPGPSSYPRGFVAKYNKDGNLLFAFSVGGNPDARTELTGIDVTPDYRFYVSGQFIGKARIAGTSGTVLDITSRGNYDAFMAKYTDIGTLYWLIQAGGTGNDFGKGAGADKLGGGYLMGSYESTASFNSTLGGTIPITKMAVGGSDGFVLKVTPNGQLDWVTSMGGAFNENVADVSADPRGNGVVAVGGFTMNANFGSTTLSSTGFYDAFAVRLSNTGAFEWATKAGGYANDEAKSVRLDSKGYPYVGISFNQTITAPFGGSPITSAGGQDGAIFRLDAATGVALPNGTTLISGPNTETVLGVDTAYGGGVVAAGNLMVGTRLGNGNTFISMSVDGWVAKFKNLASVRVGEEESISLKQTGLVAYPNPSSGSFTLSIASPLPAGSYPVKVMDVNGRIVRQELLESTQLTMGYLLEAKLPSGLYMVSVAGHTCRVMMQ